MTKIKNKIKSLILLSLPLFLPVLVLAQSATSIPAPRTPSNFGALVTMILGFIAYLIPLLIAIGLLVFFWGLAKFIHHAEEEDKGEDKKKMLWGIITLAVMFGIWGKVRLLQSFILGSYLLPPP